MQMFLIVFGAMLVFMVIMSVGVLLGRKPISGSCGGMAALGMKTECDVCGGNKSRCDEVNSETRLAYAASPVELFSDGTKPTNG